MSRQQCCFCFSRVSIEEKQENNFAISLRTDWQSESCAPRQKTLIMANRQKQNPDWKLIPVDIVSWWGGGRFFRWGNSYFGKHWSDVSEIRCCRLSGVFFLSFFAVHYRVPRGTDCLVMWRRIWTDWERNDRFNYNLFRIQLWKELVDFKTNNKLKQLYHWFLRARISFQQTVCFSSIQICSKIYVTVTSIFAKTVCRTNNSFPNYCIILTLCQY